MAEQSTARVLHLTLKKRWFDMIARGEKREEYREIKDYWRRRLEGYAYDVIQFRNGYRTDSPILQVELTQVRRGQGRTEWGAPAGQEVYILELGRIVHGN